MKKGEGRPGWHNGHRRANGLHHLIPEGVVPLPLVSADCWVCFWCFFRIFRLPSRSPVGFGFLARRLWCFLCFPGRWLINPSVAISAQTLLLRRCRCSFAAGVVAFCRFCDFTLFLATTSTSNPWTVTHPTAKRGPRCLTGIAVDVYRVPELGAR